MAEYEHQHEHDDDEHDHDDGDDDHDDDHDDDNDGDHDDHDDDDDDDHDDHDEDRDGDDHDEDDHDEDDHDEEEGHCSGPMGMVHCIIADFGGDDECIDKTEFVKAWEEVGMKTQPETQFFDVIEMMGGCIDEEAMMEILVNFEEACPPGEVTVEK